jgi:sialidase-1
MLNQMNLWNAGGHGYCGYRIPSLIVTQAGTLLAFCEGRCNSFSDEGDIDLVMRRSTDLGETWSTQVVIQTEPGIVGVGNPSPVIERESGTIILPFCRNNDRVFITKSVDDGLTWSEREEITSDVKPAGWQTWYATGPGNSIQLTKGPHAGRIVVPCDHREPADNDLGETYHSHMILSDDGGKTWRIGESLGVGTDECQVIERGDGALLLTIRIQGGRETPHLRDMAVSHDGGETWSDTTPDPVLFCTTCQASMIRGEIGGESVTLFSNPASQDERINMTVRLSANDGATWHFNRTLHAGPSRYSSLAILPDDTIGCLYEGGEYGSSEGLREARFDLHNGIRFARFDLGWITA